MRIFKEDKQTGIRCGINDFGNLFVGRDESGYNIPDTPANRAFIADEFEYWTAEYRREM